jgi:putative transcriptional regulator
MSKTTTTAIDGLDDPEAGVTWRRLPRTFGIRRRLKLTIEEFATRFQIPAESVRAWEEGRATPDPAAIAYLRVIAHDPERVAAVLAGRAKAAAE